MLAFLNELKQQHNDDASLPWNFIIEGDNLQALYLSNTVWCEDVTNRDIWKPIEVFI